MTGIQCEKCGGNIIEEPNGYCYCDTCENVRYPDGTVISGENDENDKDVMNNE